MTENRFDEAICWLNEAIEYGEERHNAPYEEAIQALVEIQQYRAIGTIEEVQTQITKSTEWLIERDKRIAEYQAIGTVEEFKALKEEVEAYRTLDKTNFSDGYNRAIDEMQGNLIRNSRTEVIDGKICFVVTEERIKQIADLMKGQ